MENITPELVQTIYNRAMQYCVATYGSEPTYLRIQDGTFTAVWSRYQWDDESEDFGADKLTADLDAIYAERIAKEEALRKAQEEERQRREVQRIQYELETRKRKYLELKKEFEP